MLSTLPGLKCTGGEIHLHGALLAKARVPAAEIVQFVATHLPFKECFDAIGAFDVVEHIQTDDIVMENCSERLSLADAFSHHATASLPLVLTGQACWSQTALYKKMSRFPS